MTPLFLNIYARFIQKYPITSNIKLILIFIINIIFNIASNTNLNALGKKSKEKNIFFKEYSSENELFELFQNSVYFLFLRVR